MPNTLETELGPVSVVFDCRGRVMRVVLGRVVPSEHLNESVMDMLRAYFGGEKVEFYHVPVDLSHLPKFSRAVLNRVRKIPHGSTINYKELADSVGTKGYRAVGMALKRNPAPVIIPCHRVVRKNGGLGGFSSGAEWKRYLLELEGYEAHKAPYSL